MPHHNHHRHAHVVQRMAEPQNNSPITRSRVISSSTTAARASNPTSNGNAGSKKASSTGVLLGDPVFATSSAAEPSPTQNSNNGSSDDNTSDNGNDNASSPSPTQNTPVVAPTSSSDAPSTTLATSTRATLDSSTTSNRGFSSTTSAVTSTDSAASSSNTSSSSSGGMSTGAKVGLAVGIIGIIGAFALFLMLFMAKKRKQREAQEKALDEKRAAEQLAAADAAAAAKQRADAPPAPRLSLRPMSRLVPDIMGGNRSKNQPSQDNMLTTFSETRGDRSMQPRENPFTDPINPFNDPEKAAAVANAATRYQQPHGQAHELEDTRSLGSNSRPGTAHSQFPGAPAPAPAIATGPGPDQNSQGNVYRILIDFKPTMEDELELRVGSHVRMLHEYDDGWALCIRLDRSQQGVVPRTCLAPKPSKPRPAPGPNGMRGGPGFRPDSPANRGPDSRPQTAASNVSRHDPSVPQGSFNQAPRPLSPGPRPQQRGESPAMNGPPQQRQGSHSPNNQGPRNSPPRPSNQGPAMNNAPGFAF